MTMHFSLPNETYLYFSETRYTSYGKHCKRFFREQILKKKVNNFARSTITIVDALKMYLVMDIYEIYFIKGEQEFRKKRGKGDLGKQYINGKA